jgi:hypothetical protein
MALVFGIATAAPTDMMVLGPFATSIAYGADWAEGTVAEIKGLERSAKDEHSSGQHRISFDKVELVMDNGKTLRLDPKVRIRAQGATMISIEELPEHSRIRYSPQNGLVTEINLLETLPR